MNKISKTQIQHFSNYPKHHFIHNSEPNILTQRQRQNQKKSYLTKPQSQNQNRNITKKKNNIFSNFNIYINPANKRINRYYSQYSNQSQNKINYYEEIFDMRIYYCLKMLGLGALQTIFENNNINFDELLILSLKDLANLGIPKNQQIIIKKFSIDYIKNASYYSLDELQKYFRNISNIYNNYNNSRTNHSERNLNKNKGVYKNYRIYKNNNGYKYTNYANTNNNLVNNRNNRYLINNMKSNQEYFRRNNSESNDNNKKCSLIKKNNIIINNNNNKNFNSINYDFNYNSKTKNKNEINKIKNNYSISKSEEHYSSSNYNHSIMTNYKMNKKQNNIIEEMFQRKHKYKTFNSEQNKKMRQLDDLSKKQINNILSKRISSLQKNNNDYSKNKDNNNNLINFRNGKELTMFLQMQNMKKNMPLNNNIYNKKINNSNITNTKINNYINNFYNINKNSQGNNGYNNMNNQNRNNINNWRNNKNYNRNNILNKNALNQENLINKNILDENLTIQNNNINNNNYMNQKYMNTNQNISKRRNMILPIDSINKNLYNRNMCNNNIRNKTQKNFDVKNMNIYNYYKSNNRAKNPQLNTINNIRTVNSIEVSSNNNCYDKLLNYNNYDLEEEYYLNNNINKKLYTEIGFYRPNHFKDNFHQYQSKRFKIFEGQNYDNNYNMM